MGVYYELGTLLGTPKKYLAYTRALVGSQAKWSFVLGSASQKYFFLGAY